MIWNKPRSGRTLSARCLFPKRNLSFVAPWRQAAMIDAAATSVAPEPPPPPLELEPTNLSAIRYQARGNPPNAHPRSAIANAFPGLEMDFRNVWRRVFEGIVLHECTNIVVDVDPGAPAKLKALRGLTLVSVNGMPVIGVSRGPRRP